VESRALTPAVLPPRPDDPEGAAASAHRRAADLQVGRVGWLAFWSDIDARGRALRDGAETPK